MAWFDSYRAYDDDTLIALGNAGLLRRAAKDIEAGNIAWAEQDEQGGVVTVDGQRVQLDARGPQQARCDCPAPGICKHILCATLWLRKLDTPVSAPVETLAGNDVPAPTDTPASVLDEIRALEPKVLFKAAGATAVRRAAMTPTGALLWQVQAAVLVMELPDIGATCRWVAGAGFSGMVSDVPLGERKAVHLLALAALRRELGCPFGWPGGTQTTAPANPAALGQSERQFLQHVQAMLDELLAGGLAHVSSVAAARLFALNMSARGGGLPRLAALLRNLAGMAELMVRRDHRVRERDALVLMSRTHALCTALQTAEGELASTLRGRLRRDFDETQALDLIPLGAYWWQTRGGARGLSVAFWDLAARCVLQAVLARPDGSDPAFTRDSAWRTQTLWPGAGSASRLCEGSLHLTQVRLADDDRLALGGATQALIGPALSAKDARASTLGDDDWQALAGQLRASTGLAVASQDLALLRPRAHRAPVLDEVAQRLNWAVQDAQERWLTLSIPCGNEHRQRVDNLDRLIARKAGVHAVLVHVDRSGATCLLVPVAVMTVGDDAAQSLQPVCLDYANEPVPRVGLGNRILRMFEKRAEQAPAVSPPSLAARLLAPVWAVVEMQAETGRMQLTSDQLLVIQEATRQFAGIGLESLANALRQYQQSAGPMDLLKLVWLAELLSEIEGLPVTG